METEVPVVVRAGERFVTDRAGIESRYCFSFGPHYDPANTRFGALLACNEETLAPGAGFDSHEHAGVDIVTFVVEGVLEHADSTGGRSLARPGVVHVLRAGSGVEHGERNPGPGRLRFVQTWLAAADPDSAPTFERLDPPAQVSSIPLGPIPLDSGVVYAGLLRPGESHELRAAKWVHVYIARGTATVPSVGTLHEGDSVRLAGHGGVVTAGTDVDVVVCEMNPSL